MNRLQSLIPKAAIAILIAFSFTSCMDCVDGKGPLSSESRSARPFSELEVNISAKVVIHIGEELSVKIRAQENLMDIITSKVKGETLVIGSKNCIGSNEGVNIDLTVPSLSLIKLNGSGSIRTAGAFNAETLEIDINGSGDVAVDTHAEKVEVFINGSGETIVNGSAERVEVEINGSGDVRCLGLESRDAEVTIRGSGDVYVNAQNSLEAKIFGSGDVIYTGNPSVESSVKGSGNITKKD